MSKVAFNRKHKGYSTPSVQTDSPCGCLHDVWLSGLSYQKETFCLYLGGGGGIKIPEQVTDLLVGRQGIVLLPPIGR